MTPLDKFRERNVGQWTLGYAAAAWAALQLIDFIASHFGWPGWIVRAATVFLIINLFTTIILAWYHGDRGRQRVSATELALLTVIVTAATAGAWVAARSTPIGVTPGDNGLNATSDPSVAEGSIAVLPFTNIGSAEHEFFSDGITEEILDAISKVPGLQVAARTSSFAFKGRNEDSRLIARKLGVAHLLTGSVQREGDRVRVTSQLYTVSNNRTMWSNRYDRDAKDLFAVEDEISKAIAQQLQRTIGAGTILADNATANVGAHDLYLLGLDRWSRRNVRSIHEAIDYFTRAITADPMYAQAHAGLALALAILPNYDDMADQKTAFERGRAEAQRALKLDPKSEAAYAALSQMAQYDDDIALAERYAREAVRLNPNYATAHQWLAETLWARNRLPEALGEINRALELDRLSPVILSVRGYIREAMGDMNGAIADEQAVLAIDSTFQGAIAELMSMGLATKRYDLAREMMLKGLPPERAFVADTVVNGVSDPARLPALVRLIKASGNGRISDLIFVAEIAGERDLAISLAHSADSRGESAWLYWPVLSTRPMKGLREDPRFPARLTWPRK